MNIDVSMYSSETLHMPENQQSLASAFLDVDTGEMRKQQVLGQFLRNAKIDDQKKAREIDKSKSREVFENDKVYLSLIILDCKIYCVFA